jgi:hypothetical protein
MKKFFAKIVKNFEFRENFCRNHWTLSVFAKKFCENVFFFFSLKSKIKSTVF